MCPQNGPARGEGDGPRVRCLEFRLEIADVIGNDEGKGRIKGGWWHGAGERG